ncbi:prolyl oligopeptidase family serine peptidase [Kitasatospora sp. NPDC088264]|uniref:S9 family peptidase n=1 Tax=Kitasatospora sp. NPDC088264 TaxID=3155296 RepID=UPI00342577F7
MTGENGGPLAAKCVARKQVSHDELLTADGALWWLQSDPDLGGARRLMRASPSGPALAQTPPGVSVGGWLHAYGGGSFAVAADTQWVIAEDSKVYRLRPGVEPESAVAVADGYQYGELHHAEDTLLAVRGTDEGDQIVEITPQGEARVLVSSTGFLAAPQLHCGALAYLEWDADRMPWDSTRLLLTDVLPDRKGPGHLVAGSDQEAVVQPLWGPDGQLYFMSDRTGWWNLYRWTGETVEPVAPMEADCAPAPWEGGYRSYAFTDSGQIVLTVHDGIRTQLVTVGRDGLLTRHATNLTSIKPYVAALGNQVFLIGSTPTSRPSVRVIDLSEPGGPPALPIEPSIDGVPAQSASNPAIHTAHSGELSIHYLLHQPDGGLPAPLIVRAHPGPTDDVPLRLDWAVQFFVSRGFAVAEVAYRGSTGQGRAFRQSLHGHWGEYDVEDCATVARHLLESGQVRRDAVFITGASAGGYTALQAACRQGPFTAATATSAIIDPTRWEKAVPRFQRPHAAILAGPAGEVRAEAVRMPVLLIHGTADEIAAADDTRRLSNDLAALGRPCEALFLEGVGHYLSAPAALERALLAELDFYRLMLCEP